MKNLSTILAGALKGLHFVPKVLKHSNGKLCLLILSFWCRKHVFLNVVNERQLSPAVFQDEEFAISKLNLKLKLKLKVKFDLNVDKESEYYLESDCVQLNSESVFFVSLLFKVWHDQTSKVEIRKGIKGRKRNKLRSERRGR